MGGNFWFYIEPYQSDIKKALDELRQREFQAGRYYPAMLMFNFSFPVTADSPTPGAKHKSIEAAIRASEADGTGSILDMLYLSDKPGMSTLTRLSDASLVQVYGTTKPTKAMVEHNHKFADEIDRGSGVYFPLYKGDLPDGLLFAGYSFD